MTKSLQFKVVGEEPRNALPPLFANFLGISHAGTEVQLEFVFLDVNLVAQQLQKQEGVASEVEPVTFEGKTVAKIVMPTWAFAQLKAHINTIFDQIEVANASEKTSEERSYGS